MIKRSNDECTNLVRIVGNMSEFPFFFLEKNFKKSKKFVKSPWRWTALKSRCLSEKERKEKNMLSKNNNIELLFKQTNTIVKCFIQCHTYYCYLYYYKYIRPNILFLILKRNTTTSIQCYLISDWRYFQFVL